MGYHEGEDLIAMRYALLGLLFLQAPKDLKESSAAMEKLKSYRFTIKVTHKGEPRPGMEGEYFAPGVLHLRTEKGEFARHGDTRLVKRDGEWVEPARLPRKLEAQDAAMPHDWVRKIAEQCPALKKEKSAKIGAATVDIYVHSLAHDAARKSFEGGGMPLIGSVMDWSKTQNGVLFYIGRDDLVYKVEQRIDGRDRDDKKIDHLVVIEFSEFNKARSKLPPEVKAKLGIKE